MKCNKYANLFPLMRGDEYGAFLDDIQENGQLDPITIYKDEILDGRNRYNVCLDLDIEPIYEEYEQDEKNILQFVLSRNLNRRHLNETQRAVVASKLANMPLGGEMYRSADLPTDGIKQSEAADTFNVSERLIRQVKAIEKDAPEYLELMESGELTANAVTKEIKENKRKRELEIEREKIESGEIVLPEGLFEVIVVDPTWPYGTKYDAEGRRVANPFPAFTLFTKLYF